MIDVSAMLDGNAYPVLVSAGAAATLLAAAWVAAWLAARAAGPELARLWSRLAGARVDGIVPRICALARFLIFAVLVAIAIKADEHWPEHARLILGIPLAGAVGMLAATFARGLHFPDWAAAALGVAAFVPVLADVLDGLGAITNLLAQIGITVGSARLSLLTLVEAAIAILVLFAVFRLVSRVVNHSINRATRLDMTQKVLAQKLSGVALFLAAFFIGIDIVGIDLTALAVFSGAFGLAVGFGLQKTVGNLIAGIILLMDRSIKPGDVIAVGDSFGHVTRIGVRAVSIVTRDGKEHLIPNEILMTEEVENWSYSSTDVRVHIPVGVAYDCDLALAQKLMIEAAAAPSRVLQTPGPSVWMRGFGESSVDHDILVWIRDPEAGVGNVQSEILNRLWVLFKENGISLPFPQRDVRIKELPGSSGSGPDGDLPPKVMDRARR